MTPELLSPDNLLNAPTDPLVRMVPCQIGDKIELMSEVGLQCRRGGHEDDNEIARWVEYRLDGVLVHRSAHVHLKKAFWPAQGEVASPV